jgi:hypothetical protein
MLPNSSDFGQVSQWLERQQQRITELEAENLDLRRQLEDLRRGIGVAVMIHGRPIALTVLPPAGSSGHQNPAPFDAPRGYGNAGAGHQSAMTPGAAPERQALPMRHEPRQLQAPVRHEAGQAPFTENAWLTGPTRAVPAPTPKPRAEGHHRAQELRSPHGVTPSWLRDDTNPAKHSRTQDDPDETLQWQESEQQYGGHAPRQVRPPANPVSLPSEPRLDVADPRVPPLPELNGQRPGVKRHRASNNPYNDSFVLG